MKIAIVFNLFREDTIGIYFKRAFEQLGHHCDHFWTKNSQSVPRGYDLYLRVDDDWYEQDLLAHLQPRVLWANDVHMPGSMKHLRRMARSYDFVFTPSTLAEAEFRKNGSNAFWVSQGCDPEVHKKFDFAKKYDIGFIGTEGGMPRKFFLQAIRERYPNSFIGHAPYTKMSEIYSQSKIGFNLAVRHEYFVMRCYEILSCGAMLLMHRMVDESTERLGFQNGVHHVEFTSPKQMFSSIEYYLSHDVERERIAKTGHEFTVACHRYVDRVSQMLEIMQSAHTPYFSKV